MQEWFPVEFSVLSFAWWVVSSVGDLYKKFVAKHVELGEVGLFDTNIVSFHFFKLRSVKNK